MIQFKKQSTSLQSKKCKKWGECSRKIRKGNVDKCKMKGYSAAGINPVDWVIMSVHHPVGAPGGNCKSRKQSSYFVFILKVVHALDTLLETVSNHMESCLFSSCYLQTELANFLGI